MSTSRIERRHHIPTSFLRESPSVRRRAAANQKHEALAEGLKIVVAALGPKQRAAIARELAKEAANRRGAAQQTVLKLSLSFAAEWLYSTSIGQGATVRPIMNGSL